MIIYDKMKNRSLKFLVKIVSIAGTRSSRVVSSMSSIWKNLYLFIYFVGSITDQTVRSFLQIQR